MKGFEFETGRRAGVIPIRVPPPGRPPMFRLVRQHEGNDGAVKDLFVREDQGMLLERSKNGVSKAKCLSFDFVRSCLVPAFPSLRSRCFVPSSTRERS